MRTAAEINQRLTLLESIHAVDKLSPARQGVLWGLMAAMRWMLGRHTGWPKECTKAAFERLKREAQK